MICPTCGKVNESSSEVCSQCGEPLTDAAHEARAKEAPQTQSAPQAGPAPSVEPPQPPHAATQPGQPAQPAQPRASVIYAKGCLAAAWDDIIHSEGWFGKMLLLGLISIVPILNFVVLGYAMKWARQLPLGEVKPMPKQIFADGAFVNGFYAFVYGLVIGIVLGIGCGILAFIPLLGALASVVLSVLVALFSYLAFVRIGIADSLGAGFDISQIWDAFKKDLGALFCAGFLPQLIIGAIATVLVVIIAMIFMVPFLGQIVGAAYGNYGHSGMSMADGYLMLSMLSTALPAVLLCYVVISMLSAIETVLAMRAVGHYVARCASDWSTIAPPVYNTYYQV